VFGVLRAAHGRSNNLISQEFDKAADGNTADRRFRSAFPDLESVGPAHSGPKDAQATNESTPQYI
jgi:hypothetical protein